MSRIIIDILIIFDIVVIVVISFSVNDCTIVVLLLLSVLPLLLSASQ